MNLGIRDAGMTNPAMVWALVQLKESAHGVSIFANGWMPRGGKGNAPGEGPGNQGHGLLCSSTERANLLAELREDRCYAYPPEKDPCLCLDPLSLGRYPGASRSEYIRS